MIGITGQTWLEAVVIAAILLGGAIGAILTAIERRKRRERHNSHRRPRPRSWDHIEEQWPSPAAPRAHGDTGSMILDEEFPGWRRAGNPWPVQEPADFDDELPWPELLDDLPEDAPHPHPSCCGRAQPLECGWLGERGYPCFTHDRHWNEDDERLAATGDWPAEPADLVATAIGEALDQLDEDQLAEILGPDPDADLDDPALDELDVSADTRAYVDDLAVLTRYRIPAE